MEAFSPVSGLLRFSTGLPTAILLSQANPRTAELPKTRYLVYKAAKAVFNSISVEDQGLLTQVTN